MNMLWKLFVLVGLLTGVAVAANPGYTFACSCAEPLSVQKSSEGAHAVFTGKVVDVQDVKSSQGYLSRAVHFEADTVYKGKVETQIIVRTGQGGGDCGISFQTGSSYLVYAYGDDEDLETGICTRTKHADQATEDFAELGPGTAPLQTSVNPGSDAGKAPPQTSALLAVEQAAPAVEQTGPPGDTARSIVTTVAVIAGISAALAWLVFAWKRRREGSN